VTRRGKQRLGIRGLDDPPKIHHGDAVGDVFYDRKVVRNENVGEAKPVLKVAQQVQDLRTDRHIQRRYRLVADDQLRFDRQRPRNGDALALPAGKFVGIAAREARLQSDQPQQFLDALATARGWYKIMQRQRFGQDLADRHARIKRRIGVLKDDLGIAAEGAHLVRIQCEQVAALEVDLA